MKKIDQLRKVADSDYQSAVIKLNELHDKWVEDMKMVCDQFQQMDSSRLDGLRNYIWSYANIVSTVCVKDDEVKKTKTKKTFFCYFACESSIG